MTVGALEESNALELLIVDISIQSLREQIYVYFAARFKLYLPLVTKYRYALKEKVV